MIAVLVIGYAAARRANVSGAMCFTTVPLVRRVLRLLDLEVRGKKDWLQIVSLASACSQPASRVIRSR
jgi:hypothetical protein